VTANVRGGPVLAHVQRFADAVAGATGADSFGTYPGHEPTLDRAIDIFHAVGDDDLADAIAGFAIDNLERSGIWYVISRQRIYNPQIANYWRQMEDRGGVTQNHRDHVHISFDSTAPDPIPEDDDMTPDQAKLLAGIDDAIGNPELGLLKRTADNTSGIQDIQNHLNKLDDMIVALGAKKA